MEGNRVKINSLMIRKLYKIYDYEVNFNSDVTFIYGSNGCGKTTILNITEAIITGQLFKLFNYQFESIKLLYSKKGTKKDMFSIEIVAYTDSIDVIFNNELNKMERLFFIKESRDDIHEMATQYFSQYVFLEKIKKTFNYVYLPLNRASINVDDIRFNDEEYMLRRTRRLIMHENTQYRGSYDISMQKIEMLIERRTIEINTNISKINDNFRNQILKSLLEVSANESISDKLMETIDSKNVIKELDNTKAAYLRILKDLKLLKEDEEKKYNDFFDSLSQEISNMKNQQNKSLTIDLVAEYQDYSKIKKLVSIAADMEKKKAKERETIELFIKTMNEFIEDSEDGKKIVIDPMGRVYFETCSSNKPISINALSSGEKQLITFFANLLFMVKRDTSGIFVVDEPELSLHLSWQKSFVQKTLEINRNIQLVFATHSPEIIGANEKKAFRLVKKYVKVGECTNEK